MTEIQNQNQKPYSSTPSYGVDEGLLEQNIIREDLRQQRERRQMRKRRQEINILRELFSYIKLIVIAVIIALLLNRYVMLNAHIPTGSMKNTINEEDYIFCLRASYWFSEPKRGDIIVFLYPDNHDEMFIKRIIGEPGDVVEIVTINTGVESRKVVRVNGKELTENYLAEPMNPTKEDATYIVPADSYFVLGDNRNNSKDSRYWEDTFVERDEILAKAIFRYYPSVKYYTD